MATLYTRQAKINTAIMFALAAGTMAANIGANAGAFTWVVVILTLKGKL